MSLFYMHTKYCDIYFNTYCKKIKNNLLTVISTYPNIYERNLSKVIGTRRVWTNENKQKASHDELEYTIKMLLVIQYKPKK